MVLLYNGMWGRHVNLGSVWLFMVFLTAYQVGVGCSGFEEELWLRFVALDEVGGARCRRGLNQAAEEDWHCQESGGDKNQHCSNAQPVVSFVYLVEGNGRLDGKF